MSDSLVSKLNWSVVSTVICCCIIFIYYALYKKGKRLHFEDYIICFLLVVISSLRYGVGSDYFRYLEGAARWVRLFDSDVKSLFTDNVLQRYSFEIGYKILSVISHRISESPYMVFWLVSFVIYIPLIIYCRKNTRDSRIAVAVYLLFGYWDISLNVIGQSVAMILMLIANKAMDDKKYIVSVLLIICAVTFHTTAIVAAVLILLSKTPFFKRFLEPTRGNLIKMVVIGIAMRFATGLFGNILSRSSIFASYTRYLSTGVSDIVARRYTMIGTFIEGILVLMFLYMAIKKLENDSMRDKKLSNVSSMIMIGIPFNIVGISRSDWMWLSNRFAEYFFIFLIVLIPEIIINSETDTKRGVIAISNKYIPFWLTMIFWHAIFAIVMFNNNHFVIDTYLFK